MLFGLTAQFLYFMNWANCFPKCLFNCFKIIWCCGFDQIYIELELLALVIHNLIWNYQAEQTNTQHFPLFSLGQQYQTGGQERQNPLCHCFVIIYTLKWEARWSLESDEAMLVWRDTTLCLPWILAVLRLLIKFLTCSYTERTFK